MRRSSPRRRGTAGRGGVFCGEAHRVAFEKAHAQADEQRRRRAPAPAGDQRGILVRGFGSNGDTPSLIEDSRSRLMAGRSDPSPAPDAARASRRRSRDDLRKHIRRVHRCARRARHRHPSRSRCRVVGLRPTIPSWISATYAVLSISMWLLPRCARGGAAGLARLRSPQLDRHDRVPILVIFTSTAHASPGSSINTWRFSSAVLMGRTDAAV